jgi:hypothetical protein
MGILWIILIGFIAGIIARFVSRGPNNPSGFILTTVLGTDGGTDKALALIGAVPTDELADPGCEKRPRNCPDRPIHLEPACCRTGNLRSRRWTTLGCMIAGLAGRLTGKSGIKYRKEARFVL